MNACTIVARNYLGQATVLAESFLAHHPGGTVTTLVIDAEFGMPPSLSPALGAVGLEATGLEPREAHRMAMAYSVVEFATAVKPFLLRALLQSGMEDVVYLDPDIQVFEPLEDIAALARERGIVVTPHLERPLPRDEELTDVESVVLDAGVFNLGFIGVGRKGLPFLDWWGERLARDCVIDTARARFVDQRWIDLVPGYFEHVNLRDPTIDVAWWNLALRDLSHDERGYAVEGAPLRFFHFSGYDPRRPHLLSTHAGPAPRVLLSERPVVQRICDEYGALLAAAGHSELRNQEYGFAAIPGGPPIDSRMRRLYRDELADAERAGGAEPPNPFVDGEAAAFVGWLREPTGPIGVPARVPRYLRRMREERPDLIVRFPDIDGADGLAFLEWCRDVGRDEESLPAVLVDAPAPPPAPAPAITPRPGIQLAGYLSAEAGVGEVARRLLDAVRLTGLPHSVVTYDRTPSRRNHPQEAAGDDGPYDVSLICVNADQLPSFNHEMGPGFREGRYAVGVWWWEVDRFPHEFGGALDIVNEVWVGSDYVRAAIAATTDTPVHTIPIPVTAPAPSPGSRAALGLEDGFLFYFSFDFASVVERKNPLGLVEAFRRAFPAGSGPRLLVRSINGHRHLLDLERLRHAAADRDDIVIQDGYLDHALKDGLMCECDCYVSLHRSEGLGLTMAEAMAAGRPVIATAHSGNLEFMTEDNSLLVPVRSLIPVGRGKPPYPPDARWADPDLDAAAELMRRAVSEPGEMAELGERARHDVLERFSVERTAAAIADHFARIHTAWPPAPTAEAAPVAPALDRARRWISEGPTIPWDADGNVADRGARRALLRALRPYLARRAEFDTALVQAAEEAAADVQARAEAQATDLRGLRRSVDPRLDAIEQRLAAIEATLRESAPRASQVWGALREPPYTSDPSLLRTRDPSGRPAIGFDEGALEGTGYRGFEDVFRGGEDFIRERLRVYLDVVGSRAPVLDVGCGRGEFLDLLAEAGIPATGIDTDEGMVARCREKGHSVERADAISWLEGRAEGEFGSIFCAQVIEHLSESELMSFLALSHRALAPGGVLIAETVNPHPIASFKAFWVDLTHTSPIFPEVAVVLCGITGFAAARVMFPAGTGELDDDLFTQGQYAVVARRAPATG